MSADNDGDSQMLSSPSDSEPSNPTTTTTAIPNTSQPPSASDPATLSPPSSGTRASTRSSAPEPPTTTTTMPPASHAGANANGKRPLNALSNNDAAPPTTTTATTTTPSETTQSSSSTKPSQFTPRSYHGHSPAGKAFTYTYTRQEDEPGHAWLSKKAQDESARAWDGLAHKDYSVASRYGDPFEMAENERAEIESLKT